MININTTKRPRIMKALNKHQKGVTLIEMILVIGLVSIATVITFFEKKLDMEQMRAKQTGVLLFEYNNAVRSWLSENLGSNIDPPPGSAWLKHTSCPGGTSTIAYLPCSFPEATAATPIRFGKLTIDSVVTTTGVAPNAVTTVTSTTTGFRIQNGTNTILRSDLAGMAAIVASAGGVNNITPMLASTDGSFSSDPATGIITMVASNNGATDAWLRTDGGNTMNNNILFKDANPQNMREIRNLSRIQAIAGQILYLGNPGGGTAGWRTIVEADQTIVGNLIVNNARNLANGIQVDRGDINAVNGSVRASQDVVAGRDVVSSVVRSNPATSAAMRLSASQFTFTDQAGAQVTPVPMVGHINVDNLRVRTLSGASVPLVHLLPRWIHVSSWYAREGELVTKPACAAGGTPRVLVIPQGIPTNIYAPPSSGYNPNYRGATFAHAEDAGASWRIRIYPAYHYTSSGSAIAATYCMY